MPAIGRPRYGIRNVVSAVVVSAVVRASSGPRLSQKGDVRVDALRGGLASLGRVEQLLLEERDQHVVGVLGQPRRRHRRGVDLVEHGDLRVAPRVIGVGVVFQIADGGLHRLLMPPQHARALRGRA